MTILVPIFTIILATTTLAHASPTPHGIHFSGFILTGDSVVAKQQGFNDCSDKFNHYECARTKNIVLFGAVAQRATVSLRGKKKTSIDSNVSKTPVTQLSFQGILFEFTLPERRKLEKALLANDWILDSSGIANKYYKQNAPAYIAIHQSYVAVLPGDALEINTRLTQLKKTRSFEEPLDVRSREFIRSMSE
jgi:hypothetical protein